VARIRTIKPDFCTSPSTGRLSREARLLFLLLLTDADDEGRLAGSLKRLAGCLYPDDDDVTPAKVRRWLAELGRERMVLPYSVEGGDYLWIVNFTKHQKISHPTPSRLPEPPEEVRKLSGEPPDTFPPDLGSGSRNREQGAAPADPRFEEFWNVYPRRESRKEAESCWRARLREGKAPDDLIRAARNYASVKAGTERQFLLHPKTFLGPKERFVDFLEAPPNGIRYETQPTVYR
jgi:hypothetical protein